MSNFRQPAGSEMRLSGRVGVQGDKLALELISFRELAIADQCAGDAGEGQEVSFVLVAVLQASVSGQLGHGALDLLPVLAQSFPGLRAFAGRAVDGSSFSESVVQVGVGVALVAVQLDRFAPLGSAAWADRRNRCHQGEQGLAVGGVGSEVATARSRLARSAIRWIFAPFLPRSTGLGPVRFPFEDGQLTESMAHRDQLSSPWKPGSSSTSRWGLVHNRAWSHSVKRRCAVGPDGPNTGGSRAQVQPVVATERSVAKTWQSPSAPPAVLGVVRVARVPLVGTVPTARPAPAVPPSPPVRLPRTQMRWALRRFTAHVS